jgi:putative aldouronate transport system substrate-binding protein
MEERVMKRIIFSLAGILAALCFLAGCGRGGASNAGNGVKISVEVFDRGTDGGKTDPTNNNWTKWIQEKLLKDENIAVTFVPVPRAEENQALINLMAAGNPPDVCVTYSIDNITNWAQQGGVFDLAPFIDTTLKDLKDFLGPDEALPGRDHIRRNMEAESGKVYSIPARRMNVARLNAFIRKDWLDKLGLPLPTTTQEYYNALAAFKEKDPGSVGKDKVIPFIMTTDIRWTAGALLESFIDVNLSPKERWINTIVDRYLLLPGYKEGLRFLNRMYNAGLVDRDFPLYNNEDTYKNLLKSGVVGSFIHNWDQIFRESEAIFTDLRKNVPEGNWVPVDCMTSSDGVSRKISYDAAGVYFFIPASAKESDGAMRYLNWLSKYENYHFVQTGPEGIVHTMEDGIPKLNPSAGEGWIQNSSQNIDYTLMMNGLFLSTEEESIRAIASGYPWPSDVVFEAYNIAMSDAKPGPVITTSSPLVTAGPLTQTMMDKSIVIFVESNTAPSANFDRVFDAGIADWLASGAQAILDERREKFVEP